VLIFSNIFKLGLIFVVSNILQVALGCSENGEHLLPNFLACFSALVPCSSISCCTGKLYYGINRPYVSV
jgi:hypothetical protein